MAVVWSWAFGAEAYTVMVDMGFTVPVTTGTNAPTSLAADTYTYPAFPGTKYSWSTGAVRRLQYPGAAWTANGTVAVAVKANTSWYSSNICPLIQVHTGSGRSIYVYCTNVGTGTVALYVDSVLAGTTTLTVNDWHYLALKYDVSTVNWTAELWVNNPASATISGTSTDVAETSGFYESGGFSGAAALTAQLIVYDSATAIGTAKVPYFVSRIAPTADTGSVPFPWVSGPSTGATNFGVTAGTFDETTYTRESTPVSSDNMVTETPALNVALGLASGSLLGATNHTWSSGTALQCKAYVGVGGSFSSGGTTVTPDAGDPTYAFDTLDGSGFTNTSVLQLKYQIV